VIIITDKNWIIKKVALLSNWETTGFVKKLEKKRFFELWVGKTVKEAQSIKLDAYTGATFTAMAVSKNVNLLLNEGIKKLPKSK
jgi:NosR/NirI family transcriptional regulator, nitrous oxide reductase regulator